MSNEKQWTASFRKTGTYDIHDPEGNYYTSVRCNATEIVNALNTADSATARVAELEAALEKYKSAMDAMWHDGQTVRDSICKHFGTIHHPTTKHQRR